MQCTGRDEAWHSCLKQADVQGWQWQHVAVAPHQAIVKAPMHFGMVSDTVGDSMLIQVSPAAACLSCGVDACVAMRAQG